MHANNANSGSQSLRPNINVNGSKLVLDRVQIKVWSNTKVLALRD